MGTYCSSSIADIVLDKEVFLSEQRNAQWIVSGGSGFIGRWIIAAILLSNVRYSLNCRILLFVRDKRRAKNRIASFLENFDPLWQWAHHLDFMDEDDLLSSKIKLLDLDTYFIHAATPTGGHAVDLGEIQRTTDVLLEKISAIGGNVRALHLSSGILNESKQRQEIPRLNEYVKSKYAIEEKFKEIAQKSNILSHNARLYSFVGPGLNLDSNFAICHFVRNAKLGLDIDVHNRSAVRSYMDVRDLTRWLVSLLEKMPLLQADYSNIGSEERFTMLEIARLVQGFFSNVSVKELSLEDIDDVYAADTGAVKKILNEYNQFPLSTAMKFWLGYLNEE